MLEVIISWIYYFILHVIIGWGLLKAVSILTHKEKKINISSAIVAAVIVFTVYAQIFSLFYKVGMIAHMIPVLIAAVILIKFRSELMTVFQRIGKVIFSWEGLVYFIIGMVCAFFASRGSFHLDTQIYHAQAIQWIEEYGVVKGLGNLQSHFAYNSSYFAYAALFGMKFILGYSLHTTTGFFTLFMVVFALRHVKDFWKHSRHMADMAGMAVLLYGIVILCGIMSPASDYVTNLFALYIIMKWCILVERREKNMLDYGLICVACVFLATFKLSGAFLALLSVYPAIELIKNKQWKQILALIGAGLLVVVPFLIRNIVISGWLVYPLPAIDLFSVDWKMPAEFVKRDADQIKVWGRCLYDVALVDLKVWEWIGIWWEEQERYHQMLIYANVLGGFLWLLKIFRDGLKRKLIEWNIIVMFAALLVCLAAWFMTSPFVRYGLSFLLTCPLIAAGYWMGKEEGGLYKIISGFTVVGIAACFLLYVDHYITDDGVFVKHNMMEPYYLTQKGYESAPLKEYQMEGLTVYYPETGENISYAPLPATAYRSMAERTVPRGSSLQEGFRAKY